jgi:hypothetical protein
MRVMIDNKIGFKKLDENNLVVFESVIRTKKDVAQSMKMIRY